MVFLIALLATTCSCLTSVANAKTKTFLASAPEAMPPLLLEELETMLGSEQREDLEARATRLEEAMRPTYLSLPKDASGGIGSEAVRYLIHRIFVDRHGWFIRGLVTGGDSWASSSPVDALQAHGSEEIPELFDKHFSNGISLHHTAVLAAFLEKLVHEETLSRLNSAFQVTGTDVHRPQRETEVLEVVEAYMLLYVAGIHNHSRVTRRGLANLNSKIREYYPAWDATRTWALSLVEKAVPRDQEGHVQASLNETVSAMESLHDQYGKWQNQECIDLKQKLMALEAAANSTGRVSLEAFYNSALNGNPQFSEGIPYLRQLGALDETNPKAPTVIIPNYIQAPSNCLAGSRFYSVCCIDECEPILGYLEQHIAAPDASPEFIIELVSKLPSATVSAPRELPRELQQRLQEIAAHHGGLVPLHGRLFAQWLHHAYPHECPFPHLSGTTRPMTAKQWKEETGTHCTAEEDELQENVASLAALREEIEDGMSRTVPWSHEEELFIRRPEGMKVATKGYGFLRTLSLGAALLSAVVALARGVLSAGDILLPTTKSAKYMV